MICPFVGGGFGCKGSTWAHVPLGFPLERVRFELGDSRFPQAPVSTAVRVRDFPITLDKLLV